MTIPISTQLQLDCNGNCGSTAQYIAAIHVVDNCTIGERTPDGAEIRLLCGECLSATARSLSAYVALRHARSPGSRVNCITCQRPVERLGDLLEVEAL